MFLDGVSTYGTQRCSMARSSHHGREPKTLPISRDRHQKLQPWHSRCLVALLDPVAPPHLRVSAEITSPELKTDKGKETPVDLALQLGEVILRVFCVCQDATR